MKKRCLSKEDRTKDNTIFKNPIKGVTKLFILGFEVHLRKIEQFLNQPYKGSSGNIALRLFMVTTILVIIF